jgi:hypothetical protein
MTHQPEPNPHDVAQVMRDVTARILTLIRAETPKLNPTSNDFDIEAMFTKVCREFPKAGPDGVMAAFDHAHAEMVAVFLRAATASATGTRH